MIGIDELQSNSNHAMQVQNDGRRLPRRVQAYESKHFWKTSMGFTTQHWDSTVAKVQRCVHEKSIRASDLETRRKTNNGPRS
jgi:hypothetical protein